MIAESGYEGRGGREAFIAAAKAGRGSEHIIHASFHVEIEVRFKDRVASRAAAESVKRSTDDCESRVLLRGTGFMRNQEPLHITPAHRVGAQVTG